MTNDLAIWLYHRLPPWMQSGAAEVRGRHLRNWRYGSETERLIREAEERERWSPSDWCDWKDRRLSFILRRAVERVPHYREYWSARRRAGSSVGWQDLGNWPVLEKDAVRRNPRQFVAADCDIHRMHHMHTSGSTGMHLDIWMSKAILRKWYALHLARLQRWYGLEKGHRWANVGGQPITPFERRKPPFWVWSSPLNQLYMSSFHLTPELVPHYLDALRLYRIDYMLGYSSSLYSLALGAQPNGGRQLGLRCIFTNAEPLYERQRRVIEQAFGCPVVETYAMREAVAAASECQCGRLHFWPEVGHVEVFNGGRPAGTGEVGDLVCTSLLNEDMPLVRYRVGDRGTCPSPGGPCAQGRRLPPMDRLLGRTDDVLFSRDGRRIGRLDGVFKSDLGVIEAQVTQESVDRILVRVVPSDEFSEQTRRTLESRLRKMLGDPEIDFALCNEIPRGRNGKYRQFVCKLADRNGQIETFDNV